MGTELPAAGRRTGVAGGAEARAMTLDDYLSREAPCLADRGRRGLLWVPVTLAMLGLMVVLVATLPTGVGAFVPVILGVGYLIAFGHSERALTRRLSNRYGLTCKFCGHAYRIPLRRRAGELPPVPVCGGCRRAVVESTGSATESHVQFVSDTLTEYHRRRFAAAVERMRAEPAAAEPTDGPPRTRADYFRRELAYDRDAGRWLMVFGGVFLGGLIALFVVLLLLQEAGVVRASVNGAIIFAYMFAGLPGLVAVTRVAERKLSARNGLVCPDCRRPAVAPRYRRPGQVIDVTACRHCGGWVTEVRPAALPAGPGAAANG